MFVSIYSKPSLFNAHTMILIVHIFMNANKLYLNQGAGKRGLEFGLGAEFEKVLKPKCFFMFQKSPTKPRQACMAWWDETFNQQQQQQRK